jgi:hypothetical protein
LIFQKTITRIGNTFKFNFFYLIFKMDFSDIPSKSGRDRSQARDEGAAQAQTASAPAPTTGGLDDATIAQLKQLADLHTSGVLSDKEFATAKKKILG